MAADESCERKEAAAMALYAVERAILVRSRERTERVARCIKNVVAR